LNCAKPLDPLDKFCSYCGHNVTNLPTQIAQIASDIAKEKFEKLADRYSRMSDDDLKQLSGDMSQLTEVAQKALIREIVKRNLKDSRPTLDQARPDVSQLKTPQTDDLQHWDYEKMSDEELEQLRAADEKLHQPISQSLRSELNLRESKRVQASAAPPLPSIQIAQGIQASTSVAPQKIASAPYAKFVVHLLLSCLFTSAVIFALFDGFARNTTNFSVEASSLLLAIFFGWFARTSWKSISSIELGNEPMGRRRVRNLLVTSLVFVVLYLGLAALLGTVIGQNRAEAAQLNNDIDHQKELAGRIGKARNAVSDSIASYLTMYAGIESDVKDYSSTLLRLRDEIPVYNSKFPSQSEAMRKYATTIGKEIRRSELLKKEITSAKQIALLDAYLQADAWRSEMMPLLKEEDALDQSK